MRFQQIRSATIKITYGGKTFLIDPWLAPRFMTGAFAIVPMLCFLNRRKKETDYVLKHCRSMETTSAKAKYSFMPLKSLPMPVKEVNRGVDAYLVTHIHADHIGLNMDGTIGTNLEKDIPVYANCDADAEYFRYSGFKNVETISDTLRIGDVEIIKTYAKHGTKIPCGDACGYIFRSQGEKTLYVMGDTVWCPEVEKLLLEYRPDVIITNNCAAEFSNYGRLIMDDNDLLEVYKTCPDAKIIASHMDNVPHATLTRKTLREKLEQKGIANKILIPGDGQVYVF